jgi:ribosomal protein L28
VSMSLRTDVAKRRHQVLLLASTGTVAVDTRSTSHEHTRRRYRTNLYSNWRVVLVLPVVRVPPSLRLHL